MFNGITFRTKFATPASEQPASIEREDDSSYEVQITFTAKLPHPSRTLEDLARNDPKLPLVLNKSASLIGGSRVSPFFEKLYDNKIAAIRSDLFELNNVLSRHNFYDCETILELQDGDTSRRALLIVGDMDCNVDGSDSDRNFPIDDSGRFFQPQTSYRWAKTTGRVSPLIPGFQQRVAAYQQEAALPGATSTRVRELRAAIENATRTISDLKSSSFLISGADPTIVVPGFILREGGSPFAAGIGDYAVVIYNGVVYPAIVGDAGPSSKVGEASMRIAREINPKASSVSRAVNNIRAAYLIFPGTADKPGPPDLERWHARCKQYLDEIGGTAPEVFKWENNVPPWPTPTPSPTPTPIPTPAISPTTSPSPSASSSPEVPPPSASPLPQFPSPTPAAVPAVISPPVSP